MERGGGRKLGTPDVEQEYQYQYFYNRPKLGPSARRWTSLFLSMTAAVTFRAGRKDTLCDEVQVLY